MANSAQPGPPGTRFRREVRLEDDVHPARAQREPPTDPVTFAPLKCGAFLVVFEEDTIIHEIRKGAFPSIDPGGSPPKPEPRFLRVSEAAKLLDLSENGLYNLIGRNEISFIRLGRSIRIPLAAIHALVEAPAPLAR